ncbi:precorrin-3B synthase [Hylemonella sp. W303a]|uniref:precorrin-3B synthase n=1 Tax=Hylemonella sp. W303a TaxID=3389873 RepID=UPI00396B3465
MAEPMLLHANGACAPVRAVQVKGWCPGALRPMAAGDGLLVRVRPRAGRLSGEQAQGLAALALRHARPELELTNRANLQLRGVQAAQYPALLEGLRSLGLLDASAEAEARRNVQVQPFWTDADPTPALARELSDLLARDDAPSLPAKFGFAVDTGPHPCLRGALADVRLERHGDAVLVWAQGAQHGRVVAFADAAAAALALARWFLDFGAVDPGCTRMADALRRQTLPTAWTTVPVPPANDQAPALGPHAAGQLLGLPLGLVHARTLAALGQRGGLRLTPWRCLLLETGGPVPAWPELITASDDARLRVAACTGAPACEQAARSDVAPRALALALAPLVPAGQRLHVSGCAKGCAHPRAATTLVATEQGLDLIWNGTAASRPDHRGLNPETVTRLFQPFPPSHAAQF